MGISRQEFVSDILSFVYPRKIVLLIVTIVSLYLFGIYNYANFDSDGPSIRLVGIVETKNSTKRADIVTKKILFWNKMWNNESFYFGNGDIFKNCHGTARHCWATHERSRVNVEDFDAILFHGCGLKEKDVPLTRRKTQNYIYVNRESPKSYRVAYGSFAKDFFNTTMTYRLDSDVPWPYGYVENIRDDSVVAPSIETNWNSRKYELVTKTNGKTDSSIIAKKKWHEKTKTAVWFVSNCKASNGRGKYVEELAKHVDVDIFGKCGKKIICSRSDECFRDIVAPNYYFYLAFENSMCQDYVTEKLFSILSFDVVPVVYGGANYSLFAPPMSYINARDFDSPQELAVYLKKLIAEPAEYEKYFEWKKTYKVKGWRDVLICRLCLYLHEDKPPKSYSDLSNWYTKDKCALHKILEHAPYLTKKNSQISSVS